MARPSAALAYPVKLDPAQEGGFIVNFADFPEGWSEGDNREQALAQAADLLETMVANYIAEDWDLPEPSPARGRPVVRLAPLVAVKAEVHRAMRQSGIDRADLARRLGIAPEAVDRLLSIHYETGLDQIEAALAALGRRLVVSVEAT
jgi:antitoxin HicB